MFQKCTTCENEFFECDLREERCIDCWVYRCELWQRGATTAESAIEAFGRGYMAVQLLIERCVGCMPDVTVLPNPYDAQCYPDLYGQWLKGRDSRLGAFQLCLAERALASA